MIVYYTITNNLKNRQNKPNDLFKEGRRSKTECSTVVYEHNDSSDNQCSWRKATYSLNHGACMEVGSVATAAAAENAAMYVAVRDSTDREGQELRFPPAAWRAFIGGIAIKQAAA